MTTPATSDSEPKQPPVVARVRAAAWVVAYAATGVVLAFMPYLRRFASPEARAFWFGYDRLTVLSLAELLGSGTVVVTLYFAAVRYFFRNQPPTRRAALERTAVAPLAAIAAVAFLEFLSAEAGLETSRLPLPSDRSIVLAVALVFVVAAWRWERGWRGLTHLANILLPLPLVMGATLLSYEGAFRADSEAPLATWASRPAGSTVLGGPVYLVLFDAWDRHLGFDDPVRVAGWPNLAALRSTSTWFADAVSPDILTRYSVPKLLLQLPDRRALVVDETRDVIPAAVDARGRPVPLPSIFSTLSGPQTATVAIGLIDHRKFVRDRLDWSYNVSLREMRLLDPLDVLRWHVYHATETTYIPLRSLLGLKVDSGAALVERFEPRRMQDIHQRVRDTIAMAGPDLVAYFHYFLPHVPYIYVREGPRPPEVPRPVADVDAYLENLDYLDTLVGELVATIRASGNWDAATLIVTSDHGEVPGEEPEYRPRAIPLIVKLPGQTTPRVVEGRFSTTDLVAWLLREAPPPAQAHSGR